MLKANALLIFTILILLNPTLAQDTHTDGGFVEADAHEHGAAIMTLAIEDNTLALDFISPSFNIVGFEYAPKTDEEKAAVNKALINLGATENLMSFSNRANCSLVTSDIASEMSDGEGHEEHHDEHHDEEHGDEHHDEHHSDKEHHDEEGVEHHDEHGNEEHHDEEHHGDEEHHEEHGEEGEHHDEEHHDEKHEGEEHHDDEHHDDEHHDEHEGEEHHDEHAHEESGEVHSEFHASYEFSCNNMNRLAEINFSGLFAQYPNVLDVDLQYVTDDTQGAVELNASQSVLKF